MILATLSPAFYIVFGSVAYGVFWPSASRIAVGKAVGGFLGVLANVNFLGGSFALLPDSFILKNLNVAFFAPGFGDFFQMGHTCLKHTLFRHTKAIHGEVFSQDLPLM